ncbi:MAG: M24 family metallopeptidase, partial [Planctomycetota bacterium]
SDEIASIENLGLRLQDVFLHTLNYLSTLTSRDGKVIDFEGEPILIGDIKDLVLREAARRDFEIPFDVIFVQGALTTVPHNRGEADETLLTGVPVVFDLVGRARHYGHHFEVTRTFCIGHTTERFEEIFKLVETAQEVAFNHLRPGRSAREVDEKVSEFFEEQGLATLRRSEDPTSGYIHYLGHGIGLELFEDPRLGPVQDPLELAPGMVMTLEPGIYLPEEGLGVRIGDVAVIGKDGTPRYLDNVPRVPLVSLSV